MKKIILLFIMVFAVAGVQAKTSKLYSNFQSVAGNNNVSWNSSTNTLSVWGESANTYQMFSFEAGTLSNFEKLYIPIDNTNYAHIRIMLMNEGTTVFTGRFGSGGDKIIILEGWNSFGATLTKEQIATITSIRIGGYEVSSYSSENPCTISINPANVYLETAEYEAMDITTSLTNSATKDSPLQMYNGTGDEKYTGSKFVNNIGKSVGSNVVIYGHSDGGRNGAHIDVTGYDITKVTLSTSAQNQVRFFNPNDDTSKDLNITTAAGTTEYTGVLGALNKIYNVKTQNGGTQSNITVSSIDFVKEFNAENENVPFSIAASTGSSVAYDRTFTVGRKSTVCLPFALTADEVTAAGKFYELSSADGTTLHFTQVSTTEAYKPYVFEAATATPFASLTNKAIVASAGATTSDPVDGYTFQGTLAHQSLPSGVYGYNAENGVFSKTTTDAVTIDAFRGYITSTSSARSLDLDFGDGTTGIEKVKNVGNKYDSIYNLSGQSVSPNYKGIVIKNGKKMIQK